MQICRSQKQGNIFGGNFDYFQTRKCRENRDITKFGGIIRIFRVNPVPVLI